MNRLMNLILNHKFSRLEAIKFYNRIESVIL